MLEVRIFIQILQQMAMNMFRIIRNKLLIIFCFIIYVCLLFSCVYDETADIKNKTKDTIIIKTCIDERYYYGTTKFEHRRNEFLFGTYDAKGSERKSRSTTMGRIRHLQ